MHVLNSGRSKSHGEKTQQKPKNDLWKVTHDDGTHGIQIYTKTHFRLVLSKKSLGVRTHTT
jgi:hypothetical protein